MTNTYTPLLIVGHPRSGTTWTMWLLAQHPEIVASFHSGFFHAVASIAQWRLEPGSFGKFIIPGNSASTAIKQPDSIKKNSSPSQNGRQVLWESVISPDMFNKMAHYV